jgi:hypothetical protein
MAKRQVLGISEAWWVWVGEQPAVRVKDASEAHALLIAEGKDYRLPNSDKRPDFACPVAEILWSDPLPVGQAFHKTVISPVETILLNGNLRRIVGYMSPSRYTRTVRSWFDSGPGLYAWLPAQYDSAIADPEVLVLRGRKSIIDQLLSRWPDS